MYHIDFKGGFKSEDTGEFLHLLHEYSKSLSWAENSNFPPKTVNNLSKFSAQDSDFEYLCWRCKKSPVSSDLKPPIRISLSHLWWAVPPFWATRRNDKSDNEKVGVDDVKRKSFKHVGCW